MLVLKRKNELWIDKRIEADHKLQYSMTNKSYGLYMLLLSSIISSRKVKHMR